MKGRVIAGLIAAAFVLEVLGGLQPTLGRLVDPLLLVAVLAALTGRTGAAFAVALVTGFLADGWSSRWIGEQALTHLLIAYPLALLARRVDLLAPVPALLMLTAASPAAWTIGLGIAALLDVPTGSGAGIAPWIATALVNGLLGFAAYEVLRRRGAFTAGP